VHKMCVPRSSYSKINILDRVECIIKLCHNDKLVTKRFDYTAYHIIHLLLFHLFKNPNKLF